MRGGKKPRKEKLIKELVAEDWCFVCKDGGSVRICDYKQCLKSYHPSCVGKNDSFLDSEDHWTCDWHTCFLCSRSACLHCYTCAKAVCNHCLPTAGFLQVKGKKGFCSHCLKLAALVEENRDCDSDGEQVDFKIRETYEGLFKEYYLIIKENEGLEPHHIYAAKDREKARKNYKSDFGSLELDEDDDEDEEEISEYDGSDHEKTRKRTLKSAKKSHARLKSAKKSHRKSNKKEFIAWGSRTLIEFLGSIGKSISEVLTQRDVTDIINGYILENKLIHSKNRKMVVCDERLQPLLGRRMISKYRIYDLLEDHFTENHDELEENDMVYDLENTKETTYPLCKRQRKFDTEIESTKNEREVSVPESVFASISVHNVKLVYLKRSLLYELFKHPEAFEQKVIGCFVRVKSDPYDYCAKNSHQLMQVKGIKSVSNGESNTEFVLCFSAFPNEVHISLLSDTDFSEEECADLRQKTLTGLLMKPTVEELQQKARVLHEDLTKHWINKELALLQKLIDRANEKGQRRELFEYLEKRKRLQTPSEQAHLLETFPIVSPEISELSPNSENSVDDVKNDDNSIIQTASSVPSDRWKENGISAEKGRRGHGYYPETKESLLTKSGSGESQCISIPDNEFKPLNPASEEKGDRFETCHFGEDSHMSSEKTWYEQTGRKSQDPSTFEVEFSDAENDNCCQVNDLIPVRKGQESTPVGVIELFSDDENANDDKANSDHEDLSQHIPGQNDKLETYSMPSIPSKETQYEPTTRKNQESTQIEAIELLSDDESGNESKANSVPEDKKFNNLGSNTWLILGPNGERDTCSTHMLKRWSEISPCAFKFKVWKEEQSEEDAIWLGDAIKFAFPKQ
ncbi:zinc finger CCCH domain-containing protein 19-like [Henckelia pumila]|uniref:zinc finger CCCH domain-containing protein 19-like n=1 Tax=Henckelia pumila TaxID=405737 RepID=UPI003C6E2C5E